MAETFSMVNNMEEKEYYRVIFNANLGTNFELNFNLSADPKSFILQVGCFYFQFPKQYYRIVKDEGRVKVLNLSEYNAYKKKDAEWLKIIEQSE